jgi:hypothetical protein
VSIDELPRLRFTVPGAAGVHTGEGGRPVTLWIPEVEGLLTVEGDTLLLQYRVRDKAAAYDSGVRELRVPFEGVEAIEVRRRWFGLPRVVIRVSDLRLLEMLPGARHGELALQVARHDLPVAQDLASTVALRAAERALGAASQHRERPQLP